MDNNMSLLNLTVMEDLVTQERKKEWKKDPLIGKLNLNENIG